jgi:recombination associated protein RdgC
MWFKNIQLFRLREPFTHEQAALEQALAEDRYRPCGSLEVAVQGWHPPLGGGSEELCFAANGCFMVCLRREEKLLPASVVNELLAERVEQLEAEEARTLNRREKKQLRDDLFTELVPKAFSRSALTFAYVDTTQGWVVVDSATPRRAEELVSQLRKTLTSLPARPLEVRQAPAEVMTRWLDGSAGEPDFVVADQCELRDPGDEGGIVRCRRQDLTGEEIQTHLKAGKQVVQLAVEWDGRLSAILTEQPAVRRLRFSDALVEEAAEAAADDQAAALFDADFTLMSLELRRFLPRLIEVFGGAED